MLKPNSLWVVLLCLVCVQASWWDVWPKCWKRKLVGNCSQKIPSWYYSFWSGRCKGFLYSGCGGNSNRFNTEGECQKACTRRHKNREVCSLKPKAGVCQGFRPSWYYDAVHDRCRGFIYSGCNGNANRFPSCEKCMRRCSGNKDAKKMCEKRTVVFRRNYNLGLQPSRNASLHTLANIFRW
uniref:Tissue factor pathway inhibitor n=1 Tax=Rhipicephalus zambeziensis TaxID=60191 RepID=A0A224YFP2_9ACAR